MKEGKLTAQERRDTITELGLLVDDIDSHFREPAGGYTIKTANIVTAARNLVDRLRRDAS